MNRRDFFRTTTAFGSARAVGANDRIRLGVVGCGDRGVYVMELFQKTGEVDVTAVCDVFGDRIDQALTKAPGARGFSDHRKLLDEAATDAILIGTPDHWHAPITIDALNAGKDVYVEKPLTWRIEEGPEIIKAARVNNRVCQAGMQQRSGRTFLEAKEKYFKTGRIGKVTLARCVWHGGADTLPAELLRRPKPSNLDWARYLGRVRWRDWNPHQYYDYRAFLDFGGGVVTDLFTHWIDAVHMMMDEDVPKSVVAAGGVYHMKDGRTAPDTIHLLLEYPGEWTATYESTITGEGWHIEMCGTEGRLKINRNEYEFTPAGKNPKPERLEIKGDITADHVRNFLDCMRSRKAPNGDVLHGHRGAQASHLGVLAYLWKRRIRFDPVREEILPL